MKKKHLLYSCSIFISVLLCGCTAGSQRETSMAENDMGFIDELVPAGEFTELPFGIENTAWLFASQANLYYEEVKWNENEEILETKIFKWNQGTDKSSSILDQSDADDTIQCVFADNNDHIYVFGYIAENSIIQFYLKKMDSDGMLVWQTMLEAEDMGILDGMNIRGGIADQDGRICLYDFYGNFYLYDTQGKFQQRLRAETSSENGIVQTQDGSLYGYYFDDDSAAANQCLVLFLVDLEKGSLGTKYTYQPDNALAAKTVWGGSGNRVIVADADNLWEVNAESGEAVKILSLDGEYVNIDGSQIQGVTLLGENEILIYLYDNSYNISECAVISYQSADMLPEKETVTLGMTKDYQADRLGRFVKRFNRKSTRWMVKIIDYFSYEEEYDNFLDEFTLDVLNGNAPDIIDARSIPLSLLEGKGIFKNLEPYFEESEAVKPEELLDSIWRAGCQYGGVNFVIPWFALDACAVEKDILGGRTWNLETLIWLLDSYPESDMLYYMSSGKRIELLLYALQVSINNFYDNQSGECRFLGQEFMALLEEIGNVEENENISGYANQEDIMQQFLSGEVLVYRQLFSKMTGFQKTNKSLQDTVEWVGFPSELASYNQFQSFLMLGINSSSSKQEGAWEFLEYLLSEEAQNWTDQQIQAFPVRKEGFEHYIRATPLMNEDMSREYATEEECVQLRKMADNACLNPWQIFNPVYNIILEESQAYFTGDKDLKETAAIIQNRVNLYLEERLE